MMTNEIEKGILLTPDGKIRTIDINDALHDLQELADGYFECVDARFCGRDYIMCVNEDGKFLELKQNLLASLFVDNDIIVGNAVIMKVVQTDDGEYDIAGMPDDEAREVIDEILGYVVDIRDAIKERE